MGTLFRRQDNGIPMDEQAAKVPPEIHLLGDNKNHFFADAIEGQIMEIFQGGVKIGSI